jgi:hypothetical protein
MTVPAIEAIVAKPRSSRLRYAWLFSPGADVAMVLVPITLVIVSYAVAAHLNQDAWGSSKNYAGWLTAFVLGNTSHVLLTYLLLGARRDMLRATERQALTVSLVGAFVFVFSLFLMRLTSGDPWTRPLYEAVVVIFATHHTLSQAKGFWALYGLRGAKEGLPAPHPRERDLQKHFVPLALLLIAVKWTLVGRSPGASPYTNVNPGEDAVLPFAVTYGLIAAWLIYVGALFRTLLAHDAVNVPKLGYLGAQSFVVLVELVLPTWGMTMAAGIHGLEYYLLTRKMLAPTADEATSKLTSALCWPAMIAAMSPILIFGLINNPWIPLGKAIPEGARAWALMLINACVLAHYSTDAFIFRFRIPGVRKVALTRLGYQ